MTRLNNLEDVYNELVRVDFNFESLPVNSKYRQYYKYKTDPEVRALPEGSAQVQGKRQRVGVKPFGLTAGPGNQRRVGVSKRSLDKVVGASNDFGSLSNVYGVVTDDLLGYTSQSGFVPAKVVFAEVLSNPQTVPKEKNRITGRAYKKRTGETYTLPFGRPDDNAAELERQESIATQVAEKYAVTFKPERLRRGK